MAKDKENETKPLVLKQKRFYGKGGTGGAIYGLGFIGALIYFWQHAATFGLGVLGIFKAIFWPAYLVYKALGILKVS